MPHSSRGGRRKGTPGKAYANRTDLNANRGPLPVQTPPSSQYGQGVALQRQQQALPMAPSPGPSAVAPPPASAGGPGPPPPGSLPPLTGDSTRPDEPVTAGLTIGDGPGPEALAIPMGSDPVEAELRALYLRFPTEDLRSVIEDIDNGRSF